MLRLLLRHCLGHPGSLFNVHKLYQDFRSQGMGLSKDTLYNYLGYLTSLRGWPHLQRTSKDTLYNYLGYLEESFVVFPLPVAERSLRKQAVNPKKLHPIDWALAYPFVTEPSIDIGKKLETAVFLHWRRQREDLAYLYGDREVDLVVNRDRPEQLLKVAFSVSRAETWDREIAALEWAATKFPRVPRTLVAHELGTRKPPAGIRDAPAWQYLLAQP